MRFRTGRTFIHLSTLPIRYVRHRTNGAAAILYCRINDMDIFLIPCGLSYRMM